MPFSDLVLYRTRSVMAGDDVLLQCELSSNLATPQWKFHERELQGYGMNSSYRIGTDGLLIIRARPDQSGNYTCFAVEHDIHIKVVVYTLILHQVPPAGPPVHVNDPTQSSNEGLPPYNHIMSQKNMEAMYLSLITILGGLCLVLTVVLLYVGFCVQSKRGMYSIRTANQANRTRKRSSQMELRTISSHCNGKLDTHDGFLQIVPGEAQVSSNKELPPAPPLPPAVLNHESEYTNGFPASLPSVLRKMNGNSYVLLRQIDGDATSPMYYSFTEELSRYLEKRNNTQLCSKPDESSV